MTINPFAIVLGVLNFGAAGYEAFKNHDSKMALVFCCYAIASFALGMRK